MSVEAGTEAGGAATATAPASALRGGGGAGARLMGAALGRVGLGHAVEGGTLRARAVRGSLWTLMGYGAAQAFSLVSSMVLAWLLFPGAFGLLALVKVVLQGLRMFSDVGIGPSIIQNARGEDPSFLNTAWTIQIVRGFVLWLAACAMAWPAARFYGHPELLYLLPVCGFGSVITGFNSPAIFTANRKLALGRPTVLTLGSIVVSGVVMALFAWLTGSVWSIVVGWFTASFISLWGSHCFLGGRPVRVQWDKEAAGQLFRFGRWIFISTMITFLALQADRIMLGKLLTAEALGVYSIAVSVLLLPTSICAQLTSGVVYPVLSEHVRRDPALMGEKLRSARELVLPAAMLVILAVLFGSPILFGYLYDSRYADAAWIAQMLAAPAWFTMLQLSADRGPQALGDTRSLALSNFCRLLGTVGASYAGFRWAGLPGFIGGMAVGTLAGHVVVQVALARHGIGIVGQDLKYTAVAAAAAATGLVAPRLIAGGIGAAPDPLVVIGVSALVLAPLGVWVMMRIKRRVLTS